MTEIHKPARISEEMIGKRELRVTCNSCGDTAILQAGGKGGGEKWPGYIAFCREHNKCPKPESPLGRVPSARFE